MADVSINTTTTPITVTVDESPIQVLSDETPSLGGGGGGGFAPDPSAQADDKWLKTSGGALVYTDAPTGTANPSDAPPQPVGGTAIAGVSTGLARADHVHAGAALAHNHAGLYSEVSHDHDAVYLSPAEVLAGANITVDTTTTPGSVIIAGPVGGGGGVTDHGDLDPASLADDDHPQYFNQARGDARYLTISQSGFTEPDDDHVIDAPTTQRVARWDIEDDTSPTVNWPDRFGFRFKPNGGSARNTGYFNEYGEIRAQSAKDNTTAMRAMGTGASSGDIFDVLADRGGAQVFGVTATSAFARQEEVVTSPDSSILRVLAVSQATYDGLGTPDAATLYVITS